MEKILENGITTKGEKIRFAFGDVGCNFIWTFVSGFLTLYYTDSVFLAAGVAGTIMLVARIWDGISDIIMGIIIEKTKTKWGKARPWLLWGVIPLFIIFILTFNVPAGLGNTGKMWYAFITYSLLSGVTYTAVNMAYMTLFTLFAPDSNDRNFAAMTRSLFVLVAAITINAVTTIILTIFGGIKSQHAWTMISLIYGIIAVICILITFFGVKEKTFVLTTIEKEKKDHKSLKEIILLLFKCKYFYLAAVMSIAFYLINGLASATVYFAKDVMGNTNYYSVISIASLLPMIFGAVLAPILYKKFGKKNTMFFGSLLSAIFSFAQLIDPTNLTLFLCLLIGKSLGNILFAAAIPTLVGDVVDWMEWKNEVRAEGIVTSVSSFGSKVGAGIGAGLVGWILSIGNYNGEAAIQASSAIKAEIILVIVVPVIISVAQMILLAFWDLDKILPKMLQEIKNRN